MKKEDLLKYVGSMEQLAYVRPVKYSEGRAGGMNGFEVKNGDISFHVVTDNCLDVSDFSYKGINMTFLAKPGLQGGKIYDTYGLNSRRSLLGGLFFTCGFENICPPCSIEGIDYPMHGRMRVEPAKHVSSDAFFKEDGYFLTISGEVRESELFGENMVLRRRIESEYGKNSICVYDEIENQSFRKEPLMLLYHCNFGYPFLDESCELFFPVKSVIGREEFSNKHLDRWNVMDLPKENEEEYVFIHELQSDEEDNTLIMVVNKSMNIGMSIEFNKEYLPYLLEWKSTGAGDYALGIEPSNSSVFGRAYHVENNNLHYLEPFKKEKIQLRFTVLDGDEEINDVKERIRGLGR